MMRKPYGWIYKEGQQLRLLLRFRNGRHHDANSNAGQSRAGTGDCEQPQFSADLHVED
jgi:hypothetical protein